MNDKQKTPYEVVASVLKLPIASITIESGYGIDNGWDSLTHVAIIVALEQEYGISIADEDLENLTSMKDIITYYENIYHK